MYSKCSEDNSTADCTDILLHTKRPAVNLMEEWTDVCVCVCVREREGMCESETDGSLRQMKMLRDSESVYICAKV